jgi:hypothetical protein
MSEQDWPEHLTRPSAGGWCLWRSFGLRSAGFPAALALRPGSEALAAAADALARANEALDRAWEQVRRELHSALTETLRAPDPQRSRQFINRCIRFANKRRMDAALAQVLSTSTCADLEVADVERRAAADHVATRYRQATEDSSAWLRHMASDTRLREAVTWQNHDVVPQAFDALVDERCTPSSKTRQREDLVARYVQRYCLKNETIGFFGPMAWGHIETQRSIPELVARQGLLARQVRFEDWVVSALARKLASDARYVQWLTPRLAPYLRIQDGTLRFPGGASVNLSRDEAALLRACDGRTWVRQVATKLLANPFCSFDDDEHIARTLRRFALEGRVELGFPLRSGDACPELALREHLVAIPDSRLRDQAVAMLEELESCRAQVAEAAGDPERLRSALKTLDARFESLTGESSRRRHGTAYGGRATVYEDCRRDAQLALSEASLQRLHESLDPVLDSARWFIDAAARNYVREFSHLLGRLSVERCVDMPSFWLHAQEMIFDDAYPAREAVEELVGKWRDVLPPWTADTSRVQVEPRKVREAAAQIFRLDGGWHWASYHAPDLMLCARGADQLLAGDALEVMGEVHVGGNTLLANTFATQHPDPVSLLRARRSDFGTDLVAIKLSPDGELRPVRTHWLHDADQGFELVCSNAAFPARPETAVSISELDVCELDGELVVRHRSRGWTRGLMDVLSDVLVFAVGSEFRVLPTAPHSPRVTMGSFVLHRESWRVACGRFAAAVDEDECQTYLRIRAAAREIGLPRFAFVRGPWERKPFFVDFDSALYVRLLAKHVRAGLLGGGEPTQELSFSEMLPSFDELWMQDEAGRYTSELRIVAIHCDDLHRK